MLRHTVVRIRPTRLQAIRPIEHQAIARQAIRHRVIIIITLLLTMVAVTLRHRVTTHQVPRQMFILTEAVIATAIILQQVFTATGI